MAATVTRLTNKSVHGKSMLNRVNEWISITGHECTPSLLNLHNIKSIYSLVQ